MNIERPKLLDLFCGAGGAGIGYSRAGFEVFGVDNDPKPLRHYPFPHICGDALSALADLANGEGLVFSGGHTLFLEDFAAIHASPPCQGYSVGTGFGRKAAAPRLIAPTRELLETAERPYVIENVMGARSHLRGPVLLCGAMFQTGVVRHRLFETNWLLLQSGHRCHGPEIDRDLVSVTGHGPPPRWYKKNPGGHFSFQVWKDAMGIDWMNRNELREAIPPAYTEYIGHQLITYLEVVT